MGGSRKNDQKSGKRDRTSSSHRYASPIPQPQQSAPLFYELPVLFLESSWTVCKPAQFDLIAQDTRVLKNPLQCQKKH
ncbi:hypothetical protein ANTPLA_LOCUS8373 [Anthophora plagiata]